MSLDSAVNEVSCHREDLVPHQWLVFPTLGETADIQPLNERPPL